MEMQPTPSTLWTEIIRDWEEQWHQELNEQVVAMQDRFNKKFGPGRALHRRQIAGLHGVFEVKKDLPEYLRQGVFAEPKNFDCRIRLSDGGFGMTSDVVPDIHGFAVSLRGVKGAGALGMETDRQDFLFTNNRVFGFADSREFAAVMAAATKGQASVVKHFAKAYGPVKGSLVAASKGKDLAKPFFGYGTSDFFSMVPIQFGPYAVRLRLRSHQSDRSIRALYQYSDEVADRLRKSDLRYDLDVQFFDTEESTPIEDGSKDWRDKDSPFVTVGTLTIPAQDCDSDAGQDLAKEVEADHFDPWSALIEHKPLGEIMRARKATYFASAQNR